MITTEQANSSRDSGSRRDKSVVGGDLETIGTESTGVLPAYDRGGAVITNVSDSDIWLNFGSAAVLGQGIKLVAGAVLVLDETWTGSINAICESGDKDLSVVAW
jgi:hypothetical protein